MPQNSPPSLPAQPIYKSLPGLTSFAVVPAERAARGPGPIRRSQSRGHGVWVPAGIYHRAALCADPLAGTTADICSCAYIHRFNCQTAKRQRPDFWSGARDRLHSNTGCRACPGSSTQQQPPALKENRGRAGRQGPDGPTGLDASRHRGLSKSFDSAASPPNPKASRARCLNRFAPHRPRWCYRFRQPALRVRSPSHRFWPRRVPGPSDCAGFPPSVARSGLRHSKPGRCGLDRRGQSVASPTPAVARPPLPAPRLETLIRHPSVTGRDPHRKTYLRNIVKQ